MKNVLTIGSATKDVFMAYPQAQTIALNLHEGQRSFLIFEDGKKVELDGLEYHTGGGATNTAVGFKRLGHHVSTFFKIGNDEEGTYIVASLADSGVDTTHIIVADGVATATSYIIPTQSGDRVILVYRGANVELTKDELPFGAIEGTDVVYITSLTGPTASLFSPPFKGRKE